MNEAGEVDKEAMVKVSDGIDFKAINYEGLIPVLILATQEQQELIDLQNERLESQESVISELRDRVDALEK